MIKVFSSLLLLGLSFGCQSKGCIPSHGLANVLRVHTESEPKTLDPALATGVREFQILINLFEGLTRYDPTTLKPVPGVAQRWKISEDGLRYTFYLRTDAKWSDGRSVTAQDFWNGWENLLSPKTRAPYAFQLFYLQGGEEYANGILKDPDQIGMKVKGTWVFEVTLKEPVPYFLSLTSFISLAPRRKEIAEPYQMTNGPFVLAPQDSERGVLLHRNEYYWGRHEVRLAGVQFRPFSDFSNALKFYGKTGIDILADLPPQQVPLLKFRSDFRSAPLLRIDYFILNCLKPPFDNVKMRQALALALDRKKIAEDVLKRGDDPYGAFVPPGLPGYQTPSNPQQFDPEKAKELLKEAGFKNHPLPLLTIHFSNSLDRKLVAQAAQKMWKETLGIESQLLEEEWKDFLERRHGKKYEISWGGWYGDYLDPNTFLELFSSQNRQNHSGWSNHEFDRLLQLARSTLEQKKRAEYFQRAETILLEEAPVIPVFVKTKTYLIQPYVKGYYPTLLDIHPLRDVYSLRP